MTVQLYVVTGYNTLWDDLVCAQSANAAVNYVIKSGLMKLSAKPATQIDVTMFKNNGHEVIGEEEDLAEWQANEN